MRLNVAAVLSAMAHVERRRILAALARTTEPVAVPMDAGGFASDAVAAEIRYDVLHYHLPELVTPGFVEFDEDEQQVTRGPRFDEILPYLGVANGHGHVDDAA